MYFVTRANIIASQFFWEHLSDDAQKKLCAFLAFFYNCSLSKFFIKPFCNRYQISKNELKNYAPASGKNNFQSFQDFFTRKLISPLKSDADFAWPCEGYVCESGKISSLNNVNVKGNIINAREIFGSLKNKIENDNFFVNIFLHNHNYHRFHSPTDAIVKSIVKIPGKLLFLRPWFYDRKNVSFPSFLNERVVIELEDKNQKTWLLSFVAGMGVGNIKLHDNIAVGNKISTSEEIGLFLLGSTCCMTSPYEMTSMKYMKQVEVGSKIKFLNS